MKNYYEILEINEKASQEIVEKAYKVLVKKYHPDLQTDPDKKHECEIKIKEINEAYEILSNNDSRAQYDEELKEEQYEQLRQSQEQNNIYQDRSQEIYNNTNPTNQTSDVQHKEQEPQLTEEQYKQYEEEYQNAINKAYQDAYVKRLKDMGYRIKYKKTPKQHLQTIIVIVLTIAVIFLICQIPFVKDYLHSIYEENSAIRWIVDTITGLFNKK